MARYDISSGQVRSGITLNYDYLNYDYMHVYYSGTAIATAVNSGRLYVSSGGTVNFTTVNSDGRLYVSSGGTANSTTVNDGYLDVLSGGTANSTTVNSGRLQLHSATFQKDSRQREIHPQVLENTDCGAGVCVSISRPVLSDSIQGCKEADIPE